MAGSYDGRYDHRFGAQSCWLYVSVHRRSPFVSLTMSLKRLWNYNPDNDDVRGDYWNGENFSWFSRSRAHPKPSLDQSSPALDEGARILRSVVRPYPAKTAGIPTKFEYEMNTGRLDLEWIVPSSETKAAAGTDSIVYPSSIPGHELATSETEIFVPAMLAHGRRVIVQGLGPNDTSSYDISRQTLTVKAGDRAPGRIMRIIVSLDPPLSPEFEVNTFFGDFGVWIGSFFAVVFAVLLFWFIT